jgi:hypothetical protein
MAKAEFLAKVKAAGAKQATTPESDPGDPANSPTLADVLASQTAETAETKAGETPSTPKTLKELAERSGIELKDLYSLEIALEAANGEAKGKTLTLGQLKDQAAKAGDLETRTALFEETRVKSENELLRARAQIQEIVAGLPQGAVKPAVLEKIRTETERYRKVEAARLAEAIPEWDDEATHASDRDGILEHMAEYGYGPANFDGLLDHRMVKYVRDNWKRWKLMTEAMAKVTEVKPKPAAPSSKPAPKATPKPQTFDGPARSTTALRDRFRNLG